LHWADAALHDDAAVEPIAFARISTMSKGKSGTFRGPTNKPGPQARAPHGGKRPAAPPPRMSVRPRGTAKGR
jgi:hypothetical protein